MKHSSLRARRLAMTTTGIPGLLFRAAYPPFCSEGQRGQREVNSAGNSQPYPGSSAPKTQPRNPEVGMEITYSVHMTEDAVLLPRHDWLRITIITCR